MKTVLAISAIPIDLPRRMVIRSDTVSRDLPVTSAIVLDHAQLTAHERGLISRAADGRPEVAWWGRFSTPAPDYWPALAPVDGIDFRHSG